VAHYATYFTRLGQATPGTLQEKCRDHHVGIAFGGVGGKFEYLGSIERVLQLQGRLGRIFRHDRKGASRLCLYRYRRRGCA
jgi:hypothetical protein